LNAQQLQEMLQCSKALAHSPWTSTQVHPELDSTQKRAWQTIQEASPHWTMGAVVALQQNAGRGRLGRTWSSPPGNIYVSTMVRRNEPPTKSPSWAPLAGLAVASILRRYWSLPAQVKWPNDVLVNGRKICGVLNEARGEWRVTGIGINVNSNLHHFPDELRPIVTTMAEELSHPVDLASLLELLLIELAAREEQFRSLGFSLPVDDYLEVMAFLGQPAQISLPGGESVAVVTGVREDGALIVRNDRGELLAVTVGEVIHVRKR